MQYGVTEEQGRNAVWEGCSDGVTGKLVCANAKLCV